MFDYDRYLRKSHFPHIWCTGCGHGIVLKAILRAVDKLGLDQNKIAMVSGIGCSSRVTGYVDFNTLHTTHGRALPFATGLKLARPDMHVIVATGDGDAAAIGGNHFIHAARRNIDLTVIVFNNHIYGMTGGQVSPTTPAGRLATTAPYGNMENSFDISELAVAAGACFVARETVSQPQKLSRYIHRAMARCGFGLVEALSPCPTSYVRRNRLGTVVDVMKQMKEESRTGRLSVDLVPGGGDDGGGGPSENGGMRMGVLVDEEKGEYTARCTELSERVRAGAGS